MGRIEDQGHEDYAERSWRKFGPASKPPLHASAVTHGRSVDLTIDGDFHIPFDCDCDIHLGGNRRRLVRALWTLWWCRLVDAASPLPPSTGSAMRSADDQEITMVGDRRSARCGSAKQVSIRIAGISVLFRKNKSVLFFGPRLTKPQEAMALLTLLAKPDCDTYSVSVPMGLLVST